MDDPSLNDIQMMYAALGNLKSGSHRVVRVPVKENTTRLRYLNGTSDIGTFRLWGLTDGDDNYFDPNSQGAYFETPVPTVEGEIVRTMGEILVFADGRVFIKSEAVEDRDAYKDLKSLAPKLYVHALATSKRSVI